MKQFPGDAPQVTETFAGPAMTTSLITSGGGLAVVVRMAAVSTFVVDNVPMLSRAVTITTPRIALLLSS
jgi:hypothetical protein